MAERRPPMVVGIKQTNNATTTVADKPTPEYIANGTKVTHANRKMSVIPTSKI
jgi:hypothetical protein